MKAFYSSNCKFNSATAAVWKPFTSFAHILNLQSQVWSSQYWSDETVHSAADGWPVYSFHDSLIKHVDNSFWGQVTTHQVPTRHKKRWILVNGSIFQQNVSIHTFSHAKVSPLLLLQCPLQRKGSITFNAHIALHIAIYVVQC